MKTKKCYRKVAIMLAIFLSMLSISIYSQNKKVNEVCSNDIDCETGKCVTTDEGKKCSTCTQSQSDDYRKKVGEKCKGWDDSGGWKPSSSIAIMESETSDRRWQYDAFEIAIDKGKECKAIRVDRDNTCWDRGDARHREVLGFVSASIESVARHKLLMMDHRNVYYSSKDTYHNRLGTYQSRCPSNLDFSRVSSDFETARRGMDSGNKINCSDIESKMNECKRCYEAAKEFMYSSFKDEKDRFPRDYLEKLNRSEETYKKGETLLQDIKNKSLCN